MVCSPVSTHPHFHTGYVFLLGQGRGPWLHAHAPCQRDHPCAHSQNAWIRCFPLSERYAHAIIWMTGTFTRCAYQSYRCTASPSGVPRAACEYAKEHAHSESVYNISGCVFLLSGDVNLPLSRPHIVTSSSALRCFRPGQSVPFRGLWDL